MSGYKPRNLRAAKQARRRELALPTRPFVPPPCARCKAKLQDRHGNPRWDIVGQLTFVCPGGCTPAPVPSRQLVLM